MFFENFDEGILIVSPEGCIVQANPAACELLQVSPKRIVRQRLAQVLPGYSDQHRQEIQVGGRRLQVRVLPHEENNRAVILRDITAEALLKAELEAQLAQAHAQEQLKTEMLRVASHGLRNPLSAILGYAEFLRHDAPLATQQEGFLAAIQQNVQRMIAIVEDVLSVERIEAAAAGAVQRVFALDDLAARVFAEQVQFANLKKQNMQLDLSNAQPPLSVYGDPAQVHEAIANLINNAIKYTPEKGRIQVWLERNHAYAALHIKDTGLGIPADKQGRIFEPFFRGNTDQPGTGLGLHLVKNIAERHQGQVSVNSYPGQGSIFSLSLPLADLL